MFTTVPLKRLDRPQKLSQRVLRIGLCLVFRAAAISKPILSDGLKTVNRGAEIATHFGP